MADWKDYNIQDEPTASTPLNTVTAEYLNGMAKAIKDIEKAGGGDRYVILPNGIFIQATGRLWKDFNSSGYASANPAIPLSAIYYVNANITNFADKDKPLKSYWTGTNLIEMYSSPSQGMYVSILIIGKV